MKSSKTIFFFSAYLFVTNYVRCRAGGHNKRKGPKKVKKAARKAEKKKTKSYKRVDYPAFGACAARTEYVTESESEDSEDDTPAEQDAPPPPSKNAKLEPQQRGS